jgi:hypothetical protein
MPGTLTSIAGATNYAMPDTCLTMIGTVPTSVPYPNTSTSLMASNSGMNFLLDFMPSVHMGTTHPISNGDEAGATGGGGLVSHSIMGSTSYLGGLMTILIEGMPAQCLSSTTMQNGINACGSTLTPTQFKIMGL